MEGDRILIINGHPDEKSYNFALAEAYKTGALSSSAKVREIVIRDLEFDPNLQFGYRKRTDLEPDLLDAWEKIVWADHLVLVYPVWWGSIPAMMKGFFDRLFLPGMAFKKRENSVWWDKYLKGKSARIICTLDQPAWYYKFYYRSPSHKAVKRLTLNFVGISPVKITTIGPVRLSSGAWRAKWLAKVQKLGLNRK